MLITKNLKPGRLDTGDMPLSAVLEKLGYTHAKAAGMPGQLGTRDIKRGATVAFTGTAGDVWNWLRRTKQILIVLLVALAACGQEPIEREPYCFELACEPDACDAACDPTPTCAALGCSSTFCAAPSSADEDPTPCVCNGETCVIPFEEP
jgi:hypothetical protein